MTPEFNKLVLSFISPPQQQQDAADEGKNEIIQSSEKENDVIFHLQLLFSKMHLYFEAQQLCQQGLLNDTNQDLMIQQQPSSYELLKQLLNSFLGQYFTESPVLTESLMKSFGWDEETRREQHDVGELNRILCDNIEQKEIKRKQMIEKQQQQKIEQDQNIFDDEQDPFIEQKPITQSESFLDRPQISQLYEGLFVHRVTCSDCGTQSTSSDPFTEINAPLTIDEGQNQQQQTQSIPKDSIVSIKSLIDSLRSMFNVDVLTGDNAYSCGQCGMKRTALRETSIKDLPPLLTVQLNRYQLYKDPRNGQFSRKKLNDALQFPVYIQLNEFMIESPNENEKEKEKMKEKEVKDQIKEENEKQQESINQQTEQTLQNESNQSNADPSFLVYGVCPDPESSQSSFKPAIYELYAVVVHGGAASHGHYFSYIKDPFDGRWYRFDDSNVTSAREVDATQNVYGSLPPVPKVKAKAKAKTKAKTKSEAAKPIITQEAKGKDDNQSFLSVKEEQNKQIKSDTTVIQQEQNIEENVFKSENKDIFDNNSIEFDKNNNE
ncbi:MAG: putative ubiquitin carboxyl-terminal hydrolase 47 [Streblomastix strix]|uniref:Putative ubiquitin carboxyl-terminal hydrolase 47 n=1 Tax=Streblomastix strix TaxID=222440 RepID=A0A5J4W661_9EUKA|nr:MAG: putative ubiquitin carboxyl-terminal hydrolase 47 [Streblomastix strix]